jgi:ankyrin repeat protein
VNAADRDGISILQAAVIAGHADTVIYLLQKGADPDQADGDGDTPRSCAVDLPMRSLLESATTAPVT